MSTIRDANTLAKQRLTVSLTPGKLTTAKYDAASNTLYVVTGGKDVDMKTANLEAVNPDTGDRKALLTFPDNHVEAMAFVDGDPRLFINLTGDQYAGRDRSQYDEGFSCAAYSYPQHSRTRWCHLIRRSTVYTLSADSRERSS